MKITSNPTCLRAALFACVLLLGLAPGAVSTAAAQHAIDAETWVEMRKKFREKGPVPTIQEDVAALAGGGARKSGPRLIDRGPEVLPAVHAAVLAPDVDPRHALALLREVNGVRPH